MNNNRMNIFSATIFFTFICNIFGVENYIKNDLINILIFLPLTDRGSILNNGPGLSHMATAIMAIEHFNSRNPAVVPELADYAKICDISFGDVEVLDTGVTGERAIESFHNYLRRNYGIPPNAIAGPYNDQPAKDLSAAASGSRIPIVASRGTDFDLIDEYKNPFFSQVYPDITIHADVLASYLQYSSRDNYTAVLYSLTSNVIQLVEAIKINFKLRGMKMKTFGYFSPTSEVSDELYNLRSIETAMKEVKESGYRTIVLLSEHPETDVPFHANAAEVHGMLNGEYVWIWSGGNELSSNQAERILESMKDSRNLIKLLSGSAYIGPLDGFYVDGKNDRLSQEWGKQTEFFVRKLNKLNPISGLNHSTDYFQKSLADISSSEGAGFIYDAIMSIGLGACVALKGSNTSQVSGTTHLKGIQSANFHGATGRVQFGGNKSGGRIGAFFFGVWNMPSMVDIKNKKFLGSITDTLEYHEYQSGLARDMGWKNNKPYVYANGETEAPKLLRDIPEQNYIDRGKRGKIFIITSIVFVFIFGSIMWTFAYRENQLVKASQPPFLYLILLGSAMTISTNFIQGCDESDDWDTDRLSSACKWKVWFATLGFMLTYSALFTKLWRVNKVLQFRKRAVSVKNVVIPAALFIILAIIDLALGTIYSDIHWKRVDIDEDTGESIGYCSYSGFSWYLIVALFLTLIPIVLTGFMAWKTRDVDDLYSESSWIFSLILLHIEVFLIALPTAILLKDVSSTASFIGYSSVYILITLSTVGLIMVPKIVGVYNPTLLQKPERIRGAHHSVVVTGVQTSTYNTSRTMCSPDVKLDNHLSSSQPPFPSLTPNSLRRPNLA